MIQPKHRFQFRTFWQDVDCSNHSSLMAIVRALLNAACMAADENGFGTDDLRERNLTWVLSRIAIEMKHFPVVDDIYFVTTWIESCGNIATTRNFVIEDSEGNIIGTSSSMWSIINFDTRQPANLQTLERLQDAILPETVSCAAPRHIMQPNGENMTHLTHTIRYSDIDFNQHANSLRYIEWMLNSCDIEFMKHAHLQRCVINYQAETHFGDTVDIFSEQHDDTTRFGIKRDNRSICTMQINW